MKKLTRIEAEVPGDADRWYLRRMLPYRTRTIGLPAWSLRSSISPSASGRADEVNEARVYADAIVQTIRTPLLVLDTDLRVMSANAPFLEAFKVDAEQTQNRLFFHLGNRQWEIPTLRRLLETVLPRDTVVEDFEVENSIGQRIMLLNARKLSRGAGRADLILLAIEDITERKRHEAQQQMLTAELSHRVKNTLATIQSIAAQTLRRSASLESFKEAFNGRLLALARAHDLLIKQDWEGIDIIELAKQTLEPYLDGFAERMKLDGPKLTLPPQSGVVLTLMLNELATNAAKYGALSAPAGNVNLSWRLAGPDAARHLHLRWAETGGPIVTPSDHRGFGTTFIERAAVHDFRGRADFEFREQGLICELILPYETLGDTVSDEGDRA